MPDACGLSTGMMPSPSMSPSRDCKPTNRSRLRNWTGQNRTKPPRSRYLQWYTRAVLRGNPAKPSKHHLQDHTGKRRCCIPTWSPLQRGNPYRSGQSQNCGCSQSHQARERQRSRIELEKKKQSHNTRRWQRAGSISMRSWRKLDANGESFQARRCSTCNPIRKQLIPLLIPFQ